MEWRGGESDDSSFRLRERACSRGVLGHVGAAAANAAGDTTAAGWQWGSKPSPPSINGNHGQIG